MVALVWSEPSALKMSVESATAWSSVGVVPSAQTVWPVIASKAVAAAAAVMPVAAKSRPAMLRKPTSKWSMRTRRSRAFLIAEF